MLDKFSVAFLIRLSIYISKILGLPSLGHVIVF